MSMRFFDLPALRKREELDSLCEAAVLWQSSGVESKDEGQILKFPLENQLTLGKSFN